MELEKRTEVRPYEAIIIVHPDATEEAQKELFKRNQGIIKGFKGTIGHVDTWGKRPLANPIDNHKRAYFFHTTFEAAPSAIAELERTMRISENVLRFTHTRLADGTNLTEFNENFKKSLAESALREREREAKFQARRAAQRGGFGGDREGGGRGDRGDREGGGGGRGPRGPRGGREEFGGGDDGAEAGEE